MNTALEKVSAVGKDDHVILFSRDAKTFEKSLFSTQELEFITNELKAEKKMVVVNQYNRFVLLQVLKNDNKERYHYLETCRKAGAQLCSRVNSMKLKEVIIVDQKTGDDVLALAEGMLLCNYQFLKYRKEKVKEKNSLVKISLGKTIFFGRFDLNCCAHLLPARPLRRSTQVTAG